MLTSQRREAIAEMVRRDSAVTVAKLLELFDVSAETIRKDLLYLEKADRLTRVHGGAVSKNSPQPFHAFDRRIDEHRPEKRELSALAVSLVEENDSIGIDAGTTAIEFAEALMERFRSLTIVTYSMDVFERVRGHRDFNIILCGGNYVKEERCFCGVFACGLLEDVHLKKSFIFPSAVSLKNGVCDYHPQILELQRRLVKNSSQVIVSADSSKYEKSALYKVCDMAPKHIYISDPALPATVKELYAANQYRIITRKEDLNESTADLK